jgi:fatty acid desaturase
MSPNAAVAECVCRCTNQLYEDLDAWHPLLPSDLAAMPAWQATLTALLMATPLKFFASIGRWARSLEGFDLKLHPKQTRFWVWLSWALPLGFVGTVWPALIGAGGVGGLVTYWLGPWLVFHCWMSVMSLVQHTGPHITWAEEVSQQLTSCPEAAGEYWEPALERTHRVGGCFGLLRDACVSIQSRVGGCFGLLGNACLKWRHRWGWEGA